MTLTSLPAFCRGNIGNLLCDITRRTAFALTAVTIGLSATAETGITSTKQNGVGTMSAETAWINSSGAKWVWAAEFGDGANQYVNMLHEFDISGKPTSPTQLAISVDTNYAVWLNGQFINFGQWSDYPDDKTFDLLDISSQVRTGKNRLCVVVWYQGQSSSMYLKGAPGAMFVVQAGNSTLAASGQSTQVRRAPDYISGLPHRVSGQLSFTFEHRGDKADGWLRDDYQPDSTWKKAAAADLVPLEKRPVRPRPIAKLQLSKRLPMRLVSQGVFTRRDEKLSPAVAMQTDAMAWRAKGEVFEQPQQVLEDNPNAGLKLKPESWKDATGPYVVLDTGREEAGLLEMEIDAPAGTVIDVGYGEHLEDLRVRAHIGGRNFASRHVCGEGRNTFLHPFLRLAGRYIQLHVTPASVATTGSVTIHYAGLRTTNYPVEAKGSFKSADSLHNRIWDVSAHTLLLCMHEHYEDCPWREQALYGMDSRNQALAGYYTFGNYDFAAASFGLLGQGLKPDGFLELCAPADISITIPSFSLGWIMAVDDYLMYSGDRDYTRRQLQIARTILEACSKDTTGPVILTPQGKRMWNFYEWSPGMDGGGFGVLTTKRYDAPLNLFYLLALDAAARMARECGESGAEYVRKAKDLRAAFANTFWNENEHAFMTFVGEGTSAHYAELTQALAIMAGVVPPNELDPLRKRLASDNNGWVPCTISYCLYKFEALLTDPEHYGPRVFELIRRDWGYMLSQGATTFWETIDGASAFGDAGSLCHGWSGIPNWFYGRWLLGVKPTSPGFATYEVEPLTGIVDHAEGTVPTPKGVLNVSWKMENGRIVKQVK